MSQQNQLETTIAFLESRRDTIGHDLVDAVLVPLRQELDAKSIDSVDRRKQVTVLFADLANFTAMSESMDAEDVRNVVESLWARIDKEIIDQGGTIDKHIGDSVMALWGIGQTREDDPERAVHAALAIQDALRAWRAEMKTVAPTIAEMEPPISIRIGINTGTVILGLVGTTGEFTAIGDTVNTASRLEAAAPLGNILISESTYLHVRGLFELREREPIQVKGKAKTLSTYLVQIAKPHQFKSEQRGIEGVTTPMIGRVHGFTFLQNCFFEVLLENRPQFIMLTGDAGVGKSRMIYEFNSWMESQSWRTSYFKGRARHTTAQTPYGLLHDLIGSRFNIKETDSAEDIQNKLELGFFNEWEPDADIQKKTHYIAHLANFKLKTSSFLTDDELGQDDWIDVAESYAVAFFKAVSFTEPTVFFIEDIHWADQESVNLLIRTVEEASDQILMIVCTARRFCLSPQNDWIQERSFYNHYKIEPLGPDESRDLINEILRKVESIPEKLYDLIIPRASGNPYHIEEFIRMLVNDQAIVKGPDKWAVLPERLVAKNVPTTLASILEARLDNIPSATQRIFQYATVIGDPFWHDAIEYMAQKIDHSSSSAIATSIAFLIDSGLIREHENSTYPWTKEYVFTNAFLEQVSYERILKKERSYFRSVVAEWIQEQELKSPGHRGNSPVPASSRQPGPSQHNSQPANINVQST